MSKASYLKNTGKGGGKCSMVEVPKPCQATAILDKATRKQSVYNWRSLITELDSCLMTVMLEHHYELSSIAQAVEV